MSSDSEVEEYEIEAITEARVVKKKKGNRKGLAWEFRIRWKGYSKDDDTWEPIEHLEGSEEALLRFITRIDTGGRDYQDVASFKPGESFLPLGPPKKLKGKAKEMPLHEGEEAAGKLIEDGPKPGTSLSRIRKRGSEAADDEAHSQKRLRPTLPAFSSKPNLLLTESPTKSMVTKSPAHGISSPRSFGTPEDVPRELGSMGDLLDFSNHTSVEKQVPVEPANNTTPLSPTRKSNRLIPLHRARAANPLVKTLEYRDIANSQSQEVDKATSTRSTKDPPPAKRRKPGPGRSSDNIVIRSATLLTTVRGKLKSVEGQKRVAGRAGGPCGDGDGPTDQDGTFEISEAVLEGSTPIESEPMLQFAGLDSSTDTLPGYEEDVLAPDTVEPGAALHQGTHTLSAEVRASLFPSTEVEIPSASNPAWSRPTIFGPLALGVQAQHAQSTQNDESPAPFRLNLDSTTSLPVLFIDRVSSSPFPSSAPSDWGPAGKFYHGTDAVDLLLTIRARGACARVILSPDAADLSVTSWKSFVQRLSRNELFVATVGRDLFAFCSSNNTLFPQKLNVPSKLLSPDIIIVSHVSIENHSAFAEAASNADSTIWSQYVLTAAP